MEATSDPCSIRPVLTTGDPIFPQAIRLYRATMPKPLRDPDDWVGDELEEPSPDSPFHLLVATDGDRLLGYVMGHYYLSENIAFLAYLATDPAVRSKGVGSALYRAFLEQVVHTARRLTGRLPDGLCLEAQAPPDWPDPDLEQQVQRRIQFYARLGAEPLPEIQYRLPMGGSWRRYYLLYSPIARPIETGRQARQLARRLLQRVYHVRHPESWVS